MRISKMIMLVALLAHCILQIFMSIERRRNMEDEVRLIHRYELMQGGK